MVEIEYINIEVLEEVVILGVEMGDGMRKKVLVYLLWEMLWFI